MPLLRKKPTPTPSPRLVPRSESGDALASLASNTDLATPFASPSRSTSAASSLNLTNSSLSAKAKAAKDKSKSKSKGKGKGKDKTPPRLDLSCTNSASAPGIVRIIDSPTRPLVDTPALIVTHDEHGYTPDSFHNEFGMATDERHETPTPPELRIDGPMGRPHRESIVQRVAERLNSPTEVKRQKPSKGRRRRATSTSSQGQSIAAALAKSGLQIAGSTPGQVDDLVVKANRAVSTGRSPYLLRADDDSDDGYGSDHDSEASDGEVLLDHLPVTGFAVASNRRNAEFHALFPSVDEGDYLIEDYGCALAKDILVHGRLYVSENHICFHSNLFGWVTDVTVPFADVQEIEKKMTALVIPNAICIVTSKEKYTFASLISRDSTFDVLMNIWRIAHPGESMTRSSNANGVSRPESIVEEASPQAVAAHRSTQCSCSKSGKHYSEIALDTTFPSSPEKVYNLMFNSGWFRSFLSDNQKLMDIESSDWRPDEDKKLTRSTTYVKPLNGSIGPKQTKCHIVDLHDHIDIDDYISMITTTRTPDVPSGGVFSVKTRTCFTWAGRASTRVLVTTEVEWTGKSWVKGIIEKSAIDGQKTYHDDLAREMRAYMKEHPTEFAVAGAEGPEEAEEAEADAAGPAATDAQEYAEQTRRAKQTRDAILFQGAFDAFVSGFKLIGSGLNTALDLMGDLLKDSPFNPRTVMALVIFLLLVSNIWTYLARPVSQHKAKRLQRFGPSEDEVADAVRLILAKRAATTPIDEVTELIRMLDEIDARSAKLRCALKGFDEHLHDPDHHHNHDRLQQPYGDDDLDKLD